MKNKNYNSLGLIVALAVASTIEEYNALAGNADACLEDAVDNTVYRSSLADFRDGFISALEKETGIARHTKPVVDKDGKPKLKEDGTPVIEITEKDSEFVKRVCAEKGVEITAFQNLANDVAKTIKFDPSVKEAGAKKLAKVYTENAQRALDMGPDAVAKITANLTRILGRPVEGTLEGLGWAIKENEDRKRASVVNDLLAA